MVRRPRLAELRGNISQARFFRVYVDRARRLVRDPAAIDDLTRTARHKAAGSSNGRIRELGDRIKLLGRLVRAYANGSYREITVGNVVLIVAAILYFVTPIDLIPDAVPGAGLMDDATVLAFVLAKLEVELDRFSAWEKTRAIDAVSRG
jgi:uncharacterized membrane protein YkvA (DUF1232 family)